MIGPWTFISQCIDQGYLSCLWRIWFKFCFTSVIYMYITQQPGFTLKVMLVKGQSNEYRYSCPLQKGDLAVLHTVFLNLFWKSDIFKQDVLVVMISQCFFFLFYNGYSALRLHEKYYIKEDNQPNIIGYSGIKKYFGFSQQSLCTNKLLWFCINEYFQYIDHSVVNMVTSAPWSYNSKSLLFCIKWISWETHICQVYYFVEKNPHLPSSR